MATEKWIAGSGVGFSWTACFVTANLASLANGSSVLSSSSAVTNQTALDVFCDVSFNLASITPVSPNRIDLFIYPLNQDGTTYGDNQFVAGTQKAATPSPSLWVGSSLLVTGGAAAQDGIITGIIMPPGSFLFAVQNNSGVALSASTNAISYRTYNRSVA